MTTSDEARQATVRKVSISFSLPQTVVDEFQELMDRLNLSPKQRSKLLEIILTRGMSELRAGQWSIPTRTVTIIEEEE